MKLTILHVLAFLAVILGPVQAVIASPTVLTIGALVAALSGGAGLAALVSIFPSVSAASVAKAKSATVKIVSGALVALLAGCTITSATAAKIEAGDAFAMDLTNAACSIGEAVPGAAPLVMLVCDVLDATGAAIAHYAGPVDPTLAAKLVARHPKLATAKKVAP